MAATALAQEPEPTGVVLFHPFYPSAQSEGAFAVSVAASDLRRGAFTLADGLRLHPAYFGATPTENDSNGGNGTASIALRGLGPRNTLTLINGRRAFGLADLSALLLSAVDRTEISSDGAGTLSGASGVAGVANVILLNGPGSSLLNGFEAGLLYGNTTDRDARLLQGFVRGGFSTEKLSLAFAAEYFDRGAIFSRDRSVSASADRRAIGGNNGGSPTFPGRVTLGNVPLVLVDPTLASPQNAAAYRTYGGANSRDPFNFRTSTPTLPAQEKHTYYLAGQYRIFGKGMVAYADVLHAKTKQENGVSGTPFTLSRTEILASPFNPFVASAPSTSPNRITSLSYRLTDELGPRASIYDSDYWRYALGLRGDFALKDNALLDSFGYDGGAVFERMDRRRIDSGDVLRSALLAEIAAGSFNPFRGQFAPTAGTSNTFDPVTGGVTGTRGWDNVAAARRASYVGRSFDERRDFLLDAKLTGNLFPLLPQRGLGFSLGTEFRQSRTAYRPDPIQLDGDQFGFTPVAAGKYQLEVRSFFAEFSLPLVIPQKKVPFVSSLDLGAAVRFEDYVYANRRLGGTFDPQRTTLAFRAGEIRFGTGALPRFSVRYQPIDDLMFRGGYTESYLAPTGADVLAPFTDRPTGGAILRTGGNPNLRGERSTTWSAGLVLSPHRWHRFFLRLDYYQTSTRGLTVLGEQLASYLPPDAPALGSVIVREPATGLATLVRNLPFNTGSRLVSGLEGELVFERQIGSVDFRFQTAAHYLVSWKAEPIAGAGATSFAGAYTSATSSYVAPGGLPRWRGFTRLDLTWRNFVWSQTLNYVGSYRDDSAFLLAANIVGGTTAAPVYDLTRRVPSYVTFDTEISYEFKRPWRYREVTDSKGVTRRLPSDADHWAHKLLWGTKVRVGVVNLFDRSPPAVLGAFNDNYDTSNYTIRNRFVYVGVQKKF